MKRTNRMPTWYGKIIFSNNKCNKKESAYVCNQWNIRWWIWGPSEKWKQNCDSKNEMERSRKMCFYSSIELWRHANLRLTSIERELDYVSLTEIIYYLCLIFIFAQGIQRFATFIYGIWENYVVTVHSHTFLFIQWITDFNPVRLASIGSSLFSFIHTNPQYCEKSLLVLLLFRSLPSTCTHSTENC